MPKVGHGLVQDRYSQGRPLSWGYEARPAHFEQEFSQEEAVRPRESFWITPAFLPRPAGERIPRAARARVGPLNSERRSPIRREGVRGGVRAGSDTGAPVLGQAGRRGWPASSRGSVFVRGLPPHLHPLASWGRGNGLGALGGALCLALTAGGRVLSPSGRKIIAQRFNAGISPPAEPVPPGTKEVFWGQPAAIPPGLAFPHFIPSVETLGYSPASRPGLPSAVAGGCTGSNACHQK